MLVLPSLVAAFGAAAVVLGIQFAVLPFLNPARTVWRVLLLFGAAVLSWRYVVWRLAETTAPLAWTADAVASWSFAILEALTVLSSSLAFLILCRVRSRSAEADANLAWWGSGTPPRVDIFIATYNEELEVLERTIVGARASDYLHVRIFVLDDGRRDWLRDACDRLKVGYIVRPDNAHAKAGNINHALTLRAAAPDRPDFVAVLDADFVPHTDFVGRTLALFHDPAVGLVQTPQHFFNPDPIQHNLGISTAYPDEQRHFFDNVEPARDAWGIAVCCGTSSMVRVSAVKAIGGLPTESVTEDFLLTLRLAEAGWSTVYLNEPLTEGLAPEGLQEYVVQRGRWCLGMMQIIRDVYPPWGGHRLPLRHRMSVLDSLLYWSTTFLFRLASLLCPLLYWWGGVKVVDASLAEVIQYYVPYYIAVLAVLNWISKGLFIPIVNDVAQLLAAWPITRAVAMGLATPGPHKFRVTAKGGDRSRTVVQWPLMMPFLVVFGLTVGGLAVNLTSDFLFNHASAAGDGIAIVLFWTLYNLFVLLVAIAACVERPRYDRPQRQVVEPVTFTVDGIDHAAWMVNLGVEGARISGPAGFRTGTAGTLHVGGVGALPATVAAPTRDGWRLRTSPDPDQRASLIAKLHTARATPGTDFGDVAGMLRELARTLTR
ncbi:glycosyltransferase family 2 protein [Chthonobacter rhizosphaerae]|uniref:glycosyltransferase family 2 protein n=1 Tax=Chthonobacter rhizosphaerae TaxID=2735553 RepID=UPI0015EF6A36|nr:cellulose synthase catalytic subunit [Chthonobacter rhizosphaerae]